MLKKFYDKYVKLGNDINKLRELRKINEDRLRSGLHDLGYPSVYKIIEQGSIAMGTAIKNDQNEYDIDLAVVFKDESISEYPSTENIKNIVLKSLINNKTSFIKDPESRTNAVTVWYESGYHVDFAIYKKNDNGFEHAGKDWTNRDPVAISNWFQKNKTKYNNLQTVVQLLKFIVSQNTEKTDLKIGGLMLSILSVESFHDLCLEKFNLEECFLKTLCNIKERLKKNKNILNPTNNLNLSNSSKDLKKIDNFIIIIDKITSFISNEESYNLIFNKIFDTEFFQHDIDLIIKHGKEEISSDYKCSKGIFINFELITNVYFEKIEWEVINSGEEASLAGQSHYFVNRTEKEKLLIRLCSFSGKHEVKCHLKLKENIILTVSKYVNIF